MSSARQPVAGRSVYKLGLAVVAAAALAVGVTGIARSDMSVPVMGIVSVAELPVEAQQTNQLIRYGGPFPFHKDGSVFGNREQLLPVQPRGFYREYTVRTSGEHTRGARRIVCGGLRPTAPEACYYSDDHYASFRRIDK